LDAVCDTKNRIDKSMLILKKNQKLLHIKKKGSTFALAKTESGVTASLKIGRRKLRL
jgi:hypothetical protein